MKILLLILSSLAFSACNVKDNKTSESQIISAYEQQAFLVLPHNDDTSILREKLLNIRLNNLIGQTSNQKVLDDDTFKFGKESFVFNANERLEYEKKRSSSAEIVVSYHDRTEIYFVPTGITREQMLLELNLKKEEGDVLSWGLITPGALVKAQTYYLLSASKNDLLKNDRKFFSKKTELAESTNNAYQFSKNQKITLNFSFEYFRPEIQLTDVPGPERTCKRDMSEAGLCEPCMGKIESKTGRMILTDWSLRDFGLAILINGKEISVGDLNPVLAQDKKSVSVTLDLEEYATEDQVSIQFINPRIAPLTKTVRASDFGGNCASRNPGINSTLDLTPSARMHYYMEIYGRNLKL